MDDDAPMIFGFIDGLHLLPPEVATLLRPEFPQIRANALGVLAGDWALSRGKDGTWELLAGDAPAAGILADIQQVAVLLRGHYTALSAEIYAGDTLTASFKA
jgi:hypothetical protein